MKYRHLNLELRVDYFELQASVLRVALKYLWKFKFEIGVVNSVNWKWAKIHIIGFPKAYITEKSCNKICESIDKCML